MEKASQSIKVKHYSEALEDLNAAIEADATLSEAYSRRANVLRQLCRCVYCLFLNNLYEFHSYYLVVIAANFVVFCMI